MSKFLIAVLVLVSAIASAQQPSCATKTLYSLASISLAEDVTQIKSPDSKKTLVVRREREERMIYTVTYKGRSFKATLPGFNGEVAWSPDSQAIAVSETEGGGGIGSRVYLFFIQESGLKKVETSKPIEMEFGNPVLCETKVPPNTGFVAWGKDSSRVFVAAEIVPISLCKCMGAYRVYELKVPELEVVRTYSQVDARKEFANLLGCELRKPMEEGCVEKLEHAKKP